MAQSFIPQPYPLYAVTIKRAEDPIRFELTSEPIRLVLGWMDDDGTVLPALAASPSPAVWNGAVIYEETRERAEATAKLLDRADRASVRDGKILALFERVDEYLNRLHRDRSTRSPDE